jgi:hypothetical protein
MSGSGPGEIVFRHMSVVQRSVRSVSCRHRSRKPPGEAIEATERIWFMLEARRL